MSAATVAEKPQILHAIPGRIRLHLPGWTGGGKQEIESQVRKESGVSRVQANPLTGNLLITFDSTITNEQTLLHSFYTLDLQQLNEQQSHQPAPPPTRREKRGQTIRARIAVRGMDRDPQLAKRVVEHLERHPGIRAQANPLTGRVLVEFTEHEANLDDLIADVVGLELPELPGEDRPAYPLDPGPLIQSMTQRAVVRRLSTVEALGRVDVACADKTGTMTKGRLQLNLVADIDHESKTTQQLSSLLRHVLLAAALASPSPDSPGAASHPTDVAVIQGAIVAGLEEQLKVQHEDELPFDPARAFHATRTQETLYLKGALEALLPRCRWILQNGQQLPLDDAIRSKFAQRVLQYAEQGLRVLVVAEGTGETELDDPQELTTLGFVGISDPLRETVRIAVKRCHDAGVRVIMITGDHPSTAWAIAQEAGLLKNGGEVLTATDITELPGDELDRRLKRAVIIARATPLDKLGIIETLQRQGHTVAMTGDGVNDAPALRLADIGIAMGGGSTEVARQTADVVIAALGGPLRNEILNRAIATTIPSLASYMLTLGTGGLAEARAVAYASVVTTQLAQTLDTGRSTEGLTKSVVGAVAGSLAILVATFTVPPLRRFFSLVMPSSMGWLLIGGGSLLAVLLSRLLAVPLFARNLYRDPIMQV